MKKPTATSLSINLAPPIVRFIAKLKPKVETEIKQKYSQLAKANNTSKHTKKSGVFCFLSCF